MMLDYYDNYEQTHGHEFILKIREKLIKLCFTDF